MPIDYEKEYDNRARVPEHPEIFARWEAETKAYRAAAPGAQLGISYGPSKRQTIDMFPGKGAGADAPLALFIHGGWWRSLDPSMFSQLAKGPERPRRRRRGRRLRSRANRADCHHYRADARGMPFSVAQAQEADFRLRPFRRRTSHRLHGGDRLEDARPKRAGRSGAGRLFDFRRVRSGAADESFAERGFAADRKKRARCFAVVLASAARAHSRCRGRRH